MYVLRYQNAAEDDAPQYLKSVRKDRTGHLKFQLTTELEKARSWGAYRNADDQRVILSDGEFTVEGIGITEEQATKDRRDTVDTAMYNLCRAHDGWHDRPAEWLPLMRTYLDRLTAAVSAEEAVNPNPEELPYEYP